jgi:hypothetical protein
MRGELVEKRASLTVTLLAALLAAVALIAVVGGQARASSNVSDVRDDSGKHCVATIGKSVSGRPDVECFSTFRDAIRDATNGRVSNAPKDASGFAGDRAMQKRIFSGATETSATGSRKISPRSVTGNDVVGCCNVLSVEYEDSGFGGNTLTYRAKGRPCDSDGGLEVGVSYVGDKWNDEISSYVGSGRCQVKHYQNSNYGGASTRLRQQDNYMGIFNDETSSIKWG